MDLKVKLGKLSLKNPVTVASGTFGYAEEFKDLVDLKQLGAVVTKTITREPRLGNPAPRLVETPSGMLNSIGLQNEGLDNFLKIKFPRLRNIGAKVIVSVSGTTMEDFVFISKRLEDAGVEAVELNLSCPNIKYNAEWEKQKKNSRKKFFSSNKAVMFAQDPEAVFKLVSAVRADTSLNLMVKLSPNVTDIAAIACSAQSAGADALSLVNTFTAMAVDIDTCRPKLANITGGLSGPAIKPVALRMVYEVCRAVKIPVMGMGGIISVEDALEFFMVGATAISVGTANFVNPKISLEIIQGLKRYLQEKKYKSINEVIGSLKI